MKFWDSSALMALLFQEPFSWKAWDLFRQDPQPLLWWSTFVECVGALARIEREAQVARPAVDRAWHILHQLRQEAHEIQPYEEIRLIAAALLLRHPLRAADALQLAAALFWHDNNPRGASFVTLDHRLRIAAFREGFEVLPYMDEVHEAPPEWETEGLGLSFRLRLPGI